MYCRLNFRFILPLLAVVFLFSLFSVTGPVEAQSLENFTWVRAASQPRNNGQAQGIVLNGRLYSFGGYAPCCTPSEKAYSYDPKEDVWVPLANITDPVVKAGIATDGTYIYLAGGYRRRPGGGQIYGSTALLRYDPVNNSYGIVIHMPHEAATGQLVHINNKLHYIGGTTPFTRAQDLGTHWVLDLSNVNAGWQFKAPLPNPRHHAAAVAIGTMIYYIGGQKGHDDNLIPQNAVHRYDTIMNTWQEMAPMPGVGRNHMSYSTVVLNGKIVVFGGQTYENQVTNSVLEYNPVTNTWRELGKLFAPRGSGIAGVIDGVVYFATGDSAATYKGYYTPQPSKVENFTLIDTAKDYPILSLRDGQILNLSRQPSALSIGVVVSGSSVGSVVMGWNSNPRYRVENSAPFAYFDNSATNYTSGPIPLGVSTLTATPYSGPNGTGTPGTPLTIQINVIRESVNRPPQVIIPDQYNTDGETITPVQVVATDLDGDQIVSYQKAGLPYGLDIDTKTGLITGTIQWPSELRSTIEDTSAVLVTDNGSPPMTTWQTFTWTIYPKKLAVLSFFLYNAQTDTYTWTLEDGMTVDLNARPPQLNIVAALSHPEEFIDRVEFDLNGQLSVDETEPYTVFGSHGTDILPGDLPEGDYTLTATPYWKDTGEPGESLTISFKLTKNRQPVFQVTTGQTHAVNTPIAPVQIVATDPDNDPLTFTAAGLPPGLSMNSSGLVTGTPTFIGTFPVTVTVTDGKPLGTIRRTFNWTITGTSTPITVTALHLIDPVTDQPIREINSEWRIINLYPYGGMVNVAASTEGEPIGSVEFRVMNEETREEFVYIDNTAPYSLFGNTGSDYLGGVLPVPYDTLMSIQATPYRGPGATGGAGTRSSEDFYVTYDDRCTLEAQSNGECSIAYEWHLPEILGPEQMTFVDGQSVSFQIEAYDPDPGDTLRYSITTAMHAGLTLDPVTGVISGVIQKNDMYPFVVFKVTDSLGYSDTLASFWEVLPASTGAMQAPTEGQGSVPLDPTQEITPVAPVIIPEPTSEVTAEAPILSEPTSEAVPEDLAPIVVPATQPPTMTSPSDQASAEGAAVSLQVIASDPEGSPLTYTVAGLPPGLTLDAATGLISGTIEVSSAAASPYVVTITVTDGEGLSSVSSFNWVVTAP